MSNFRALTRRKGSDEPYEWAEWRDDYFGKHHYGVRFHCETTYYPGEGYEIKDVAEE